MIIPLTAADERCGAKALGLRRLMAAGHRVPAAVVVLIADSTRWEDRLRDSLAALGPGPFAVRSSALGEDGDEASFAGQLDSLLDVGPDEVCAAVREVARSGLDGGLQAYSVRMQQRLGVGVPVIVQQMVSADVAGVAFTRHPVTGADEVMVEAVRGLGERLVQGEVTPERWVITDAPVRTPGSAGSSVLSRCDVDQIAAVARDAERVFGAPQDVEWAISGGRLWTLQARPLTRPTEPRRQWDAVTGLLLVTGTPASPGIATGRTRVIANPDEFQCFELGDVLVCRATSPAWTPVLARSSAVITEIGGILSHAAIVAREFGIPAITDVTNASALLGNVGCPVVVDGTAGVVRTTEQRERR